MYEAAPKILSKEEMETLESSDSAVTFLSYYSKYTIYQKNKIAIK
jgi:hypothetical protein